jgi:protein involved in polysaccharide export with SLBB domain
MLRRQLAGLIVGTMTVFALCGIFSSGLAGPQEKTKGQPPAAEKIEPHPKMPVPSSSPVARDREAQVSKLLDEYDLTPHPPEPIPDDPPPHEGAMISLSHLVEPPDLIMVEVLDALPGRPISGERLVRPDGKIDVGFYGEVYVRGMTIEQVKVAILKHLRAILTDEALGLLVPVNAEELERPAAQKPPILELPKDVPDPFPPDDGPKSKLKPRSSSQRLRMTPRVVKPRTVSRESTAIRLPVQMIRSRRAETKTQDPEPVVQSPMPIKIPVGPQGKVTITIEFNGQGQPADLMPDRRAGAGQEQAVPGDAGLERIVVPPANSQMVFVDITAYNSKNYYILGDVLITGKLPCTGNETVLDALQYAGGLMATAEPKDVRLVRPGRGGKPPRVYKVDLAAIQERGEVTTNYQIFPNDRLIVGRNEVVKKTVEIDRLNAPIQSMTSFMLQEATMLRALQFATSGSREQLLKEFVDFWAKEISRPGGVQFDEQTLREAFLRKMALPLAPVQTTPAPR